MHNSMIDLMMRALDEPLSGAEQEQLYAHLRDCFACAREWESLSLVHQRLTATPALAPTADFTARFARRLAAQHSARPAWSMRYSLLTAMTLLTALIATGLSLAPVAALLNSEAVVRAIATGLSLLASLLTWLEIVLTFSRVTTELLGAGPFVVLAVLMLALTLVWVRLVAGFSPNSRSALANGG